MGDWPRPGRELYDHGGTALGIGPAPSRHDPDLDTLVAERFRILDCRLAVNTPLLCFTVMDTPRLFGELLAQGKGSEIMANPEVIAAYIGEEEVC